MTLNNVRLKLMFYIWNIIVLINHFSYGVHFSYDFKMMAVDYRNLSILSHLGNDLEPGLTLPLVTPYEVRWRDMCIHVCHMEVPLSQIMYTLNASLVGLCTADISKVIELLLLL